MSAPIPAIPLEYAPPDEPARALRVPLRVCQASALAVSAIAFALLFVDVETVLVTGPLVFILGAALVVMSLRGGDWGRAGIGLGYVGVPLALLLLVLLTGWGPRDATTPFKWMVGFYLAGTTGANLRLLFRERHERSASHH